MAKRRQPLGGARPFAETIDAQTDRPNVMFLLPQDARMFVPAAPRQKIVEKVEWLWQSFGLVKEIGAGSARHTVGKGICPQFNEEDADWNDEAWRAVDTFFLSPSLCDLQGIRNGYEMQGWALEQFLYRGEFVGNWALNPRLKAGRDNVSVPAFHCWETNDFRTPLKMEPDRIIIDGVEVGNLNEPIAYHLRTVDQTYDRIPVGQICHWFKPHAAKQLRGVSAFAQAVNPLVDVHMLRKLATKHAAAQRLLSLVMKGVSKKKARGAFGKLSQATATGDDGETQANVGELEKLYKGAGAGIAYLDESGEARLIESNSPGAQLNEWFCSNLFRDASLAPGIPMEFFWTTKELGGPDLAFTLDKADAQFQLWADGLIYRFISPFVVRYLRWRIQAGLLKEPPGGIDGGWENRITWRGTRRVTMNRTRDSKARIEALNYGLENMRSLADEAGESYRDNMRQWIREFREFKKMCKDEGFNEQETKELMQRWRPLPPGSSANQPDQSAQTDPNADQSGFPANDTTKKK